MTLIGLTIVTTAVQGTVYKLTQKRQKPKRLVEYLQSQQKDGYPIHTDTLQEQTINQNLTLSIGLVGLTSIGRLGHPIFLLCSLPGLLYLNATFLFAGSQEILKEHKIGIGIVDAIVTTGMFILRSFFTNALFLTLYFTSRKLLHSIHNTKDRISFELPDTLSGSVWILQDGVEIKIPFSQVEVGDTLILSDGESIPADGLIVDGHAIIHQPFLKKAVPIKKSVGQSVFASAKVLDGRISIQVERMGKDTLSAQIAQISNGTNQLENPKKLQGAQTIDRGTLPLLTIGAITLRLLDLRRAISVLLTNFGNDYRVVLPLSHLSYLQIALQQGILIRDGLSLEKLHNIDTIIFDKIDASEKSWFAQNLQKYNITIVDIVNNDELAQITQIQELQQSGKYVCFIQRDVSPTINSQKEGSQNTNTDFHNVMNQADITIALYNMSRTASTLGIESAQIVLLDGELEQLPLVFELAKSLDTSTRRSLFITLAPCIICLGGVYFYHFGLFTSLLLDHLGLIGGIANAMTPQLHYAHSLHRTTEPN